MYSKELHCLLRKPVNLEKIRPYIECSAECVAAFLRRLADAEGNVTKDKKHLEHISIVDTDLRLLEYARTLLKKLDISAKIYR